MVSIGKVTVQTGRKPVVVAERFEPEVNVSFNSISDVSLSGLQDGYVLIYNSSTSKFESKAITDLTGEITEINGGTF